MSILIHNCTAVLMDEAGTVLPNAYVVVEGTKIRSVSTQRPWGSFEEQIDGQGNVLMPGFVNAHSHVPMTAMRGYGDGNNLQDWLHNYICMATLTRWPRRWRPPASAPTCAAAACSSPTPLIPPPTTTVWCSGS